MDVSKNGKIGALLVDARYLDCLYCRKPAKVPLRVRAEFRMFPKYLQPFLYMVVITSATEA
ncbi:MAG: hypothetical protein LBP63_01880 [Prevotellaceae bacterium]|nr:hypothetical protein [Prevotellaceae bacterium]